MCSLKNLKPSLSSQAIGLSITIQNPSAETRVPTDGQLIQWAIKALDTRCQEAEITIRIVDPTEGAALNTHYRHKNGPTNVLAFNYSPPTGMEGLLLGDIVICAAVVATEAQDQQKPLEAHWAHMVVHGVLHLLGYDHEQVSDALIMEALENTILKALDFEPPYGEPLINE
jgi:probable rRNA maturation factor